VVEGFWSPNGEWLVFRGGAVGAGDNTRDILAVRPGADTVALPLLAEEYDEQRPALSPDGRWIAYVSTETGTHQVFVRPFPDVNDGKVQVSTNGGIMPMWSHGGRELFFVDGSNDLIAVEVELEGAFRIVGSEALFKIPYSYRTSQTNSVYGVSPDDQRFLMARSYQPLEGSRSPFVLVQNWLEELKRLVPN
jgi:Tol biopolymer transport system component